MERKCQNCGASITTGTKFCSNCGAPIPETKNQVKLPTKKLGIAAAILGVIVIIGIFFATRPEKINLNDYVTYSVDGYNGYGKAYAYLEENKFVKDIYTIVQKKSTISEEELFGNSGISVKVNAEEKLSNGDSFEVVVSYDEDVFKAYGIKLTGKSETIKVEGLKEIVEKDIFENVELEFFGRAPKSYTDEYVSVEGFSCRISPYNNLDVGDEITIICEDKNPSGGVKPAKFETTIKVPNTVEHYVVDPEELTTEDKAQIKEIAEKVVNQKYPYDRVMDWTTVRVEYFEYGSQGCSIEDCELSNIKIADEMKYYVVTSERWEEGCNGIIVPFEFDAYITEDGREEYQGKTYHAYGHCLIKNIIKDSDGNLKLDDCSVTTDSYMDTKIDKYNETINDVCKDEWGNYTETTVSFSEK